jgi:hypothetical protein
MSTPFTIGTGVTVETRITQRGVLVDPDALFFKYKGPSDEAETLWTYLTDVELEKVSTGIYTATIPTDEAGTWIWKFYTTGALLAAEEGSFTVERSRF